MVKSDLCSFISLINWAVSLHKRSFYRAFNALFGKIGRIASEDVIVQLLKTKCLPVLYYCLEACPLKKAQLDAIDFDSTFRKIFSTRSQEVVEMCKQIFGCQRHLPT